MKKLIIGVVVLIVAYIGVLFFVKSNSQGVFAQEISELNKLPGVSASLVDESGGLFSSSANIALKDEMSQETIVTLNQSQSYGPILFTEEGLKIGWYFLNTELVFSDELKSEFPSDIDVDNLFDIHFFSGFSGAIEGDVYFKGLAFSKDGGELNVSEGEMHVDTDMSFKEVVGGLNWPGITFKEGDENGLSISGVKMDFDQQLISGNMLAGTALYQGGGSYSVDSISYREDYNFMQIDDMKAKFDSALAGEQKDALDASFEMSIASLNAMGEKYTDNAIKLYFKGLDLAVLEQFMEQTQKMQAAALEGMDVSAYQMQMMNTLMQLVQKGPSFQMKDTQIVTPDGAIKAQMDVVVDQSKVDASNPMSLMMATSAKFEAEGPEAFFNNKGLGPMIEQYSQINYVVKDNGTLRVNAAFENGQPLINGQPMQGMPGM
ncbi:MAG: DUF945 family protein [Gammaproteobacteria bacterium]|nr:DUF945 family protein [Gammaproteobacteria bacterium]